jgi:serine/threonine protein kinase
VLLALETLHSQKIIYKDLKTENVVISKEGVAKITDFGMSFLLTDENITDTNFLEKPTTLHIMAPESVNRKMFSEASDWWSFGCFIYEMFIGEQAFNGLSGH